ncbi:MAG: hypothetical protein RSE24_00630 [Oscillospiraceae bacterium]
MKKALILAVAMLLLLSAVGCSSKTNMDEIGYKVGMASYTSTDKSMPSTPTANGKGSVCTTYVTLVLDKGDVIKRAYIDEVETKVYFNSSGQLVEGSSGEVKSKRELGDAYNMKPASPIGKEWYEQINSLEKYLEGKKVSDIVAGAGAGTMSRMSSGSNAYQRSTDSNVSSGSVGASSDTMNSSGASSVLPENSGINSDGSSIAPATSPDGDIPGSMQGIKWQEDLKTSVTIDLTNIQMAIKRAYEVAK